MRKWEADLIADALYYWKRTQCDECLHDVDTEHIARRVAKAVALGTERFNVERFLGRCGVDAPDVRDAGWLGAGGVDRNEYIEVQRPRLGDG